LDFGLSWLTSLQFIQYHVAGFYKPTIPQSPPSHLRDYSICNNARLEFTAIFVPSFYPNEWCLKNGGHLGHESSALTTRPQLFVANKSGFWQILDFMILFSGRNLSQPLHLLADDRKNGGGRIPCCRSRICLWSFSSLGFQVTFHSEVFSSNSDFDNLNFFSLLFLALVLI
jgi:hypothetical protein